MNTVKILGWIGVVLLLSNVAGTAAYYGTYLYHRRKILECFSTCELLTIYTKHSSLWNIHGEVFLCHYFCGILRNEKSALKRKQIDQRTLDLLPASVKKSIRIAFWLLATPVCMTALMFPLFWWHKHGG